MTRKKWILVWSLVFAISALHYITAAAHAPLHILYRELYFLPIILAGLAGGKRSGLLIASTIAVVYSPHIVMQAYGRIATAQHMMSASLDTVWGNAFQVVIFGLAGFLSGAYGDIRGDFHRTIRKPVAPVKVQKSFLIFVDHTPVSFMAVQYFAELLAALPGIQATLLTIIRPDDPDYTVAGKAGNDDPEHCKSILSECRGLLINKGMKAGQIHERLVTADRKEKISDKILDEINRGQFDTLVIGKHQLTKSQEFLFGSKTIRILREAGINVLAVKRKDAEDDDSRAMRQGEVTRLSKE